jgi:ubiquinone/menaquinone biosynthesis C-methylase UbiE
MNGYYSDKLSAERLKKCYAIAPTRVQQYLKAESDHVLKKIKQGDLLLDLGSGYGRTMIEFARKAGFVIGIDTSRPSLLLGKKWCRDVSNCLFLEMDASHLLFLNETFDVVICIQNGISAFKVDERQLINEAIRVTRPGGTVLFSTYSDKFWKERLHWFELQAQAGLLGEIDYEKTGNGVIVCKDGFMATTVSKDKFLALTSGLKVDVKIEEVDESSLFCEMTKLSKI